MKLHTNSIVQVSCEKTCKTLLPDKAQYTWICCREDSYKKMAKDVFEVECVEFDPDGCLYLFKLSAEDGRWDTVRERSVADRDGVAGIWAHGHWRLCCQSWDLWHGTERRPSVLAFFGWNHKKTQHTEWCIFATNSTYKLPIKQN